LRCTATAAPLPAESVRGAYYYVLILLWFDSSQFPPLLTCTPQQATGVPTSTVGDVYCHSRVLPELAVAAIANFLSELERFGR
jgi:hypothetical protein